MASLRDLINTCNAVIHRASDVRTHPVWPTRTAGELVFLLQDVHPQSVCSFHTAQMPWIRQNGLPALCELSDSVTGHLVSATRNARVLGNWAAHLHVDDIVSEAYCRHYVAVIFQHIVDALGSFKTVSQISDLQAYPTYEAVLTYLIMAYRVMSQLGPLSEAPSTGSFFTLSLEYVEQIHENGFSFDYHEYEMIKDPMFCGIMAPVDTVPGCISSINQTAPVLAPNPGTYGIYATPVLSNEFQDVDNASPRLY